MMWESNSQLYHERSNAINEDLHVIYNVTKDNLTQALSTFQL